MKQSASLISTALLALVLICFFLPFAEISCNNNKYLSLSGKDLVRGKQVTKEEIVAFAKRTGMEKELNDEMAKMDSTNDQDRNIPANPWAVAAFVMAALGIVIGLILRRFSNIVHLVTSAAALISFLGLQLSMNSQYSYTNSLFKVEMNIKYLPGYWLGVILSGLTAGISLTMFLIQRKKSENALIEKISPASNEGNGSPPPTGA